MAPGQLEEIDRLKHHVTELEDRQRHLRIETRLDAVECHHAVDGEMGPVIAEKLQEPELVQPLGIVHQQRSIGAAHVDETLHGPSDPGNIGRNLLLFEKRARLVAEAGIADLAGAAPEHDDRPVPELLQPAHGHQRHEVADVEARRRGIEPGVGGHRSFRQFRIERFQVGALVHETTLEENLKGFGSEFGGRLAGFDHVVGHSGIPDFLRVRRFLEAGPGRPVRSLETKKPPDAAAFLRFLSEEQDPTQPPICR